MKKKIGSCIGVLILVLFMYAGLGGAAERTLMMATTTSTDNTGLLDDLAPAFTKDTGIELKWTAVGTGKALRLGQNCDVDVLLVHAPPAEIEFVNKGYGQNRREVMYNDFVIIGPASDPAHVKGLSVKAALKKISRQAAVFVSRGDDSGTNKKEKLLWKSSALRLPDRESWYVQTGQGMLATINIAAERNGYTMTDRGTYIKYESTKGGDAPLKILVEGDTVLMNQYSVIEISPRHCPNVQNKLAVAFAQWLVSVKTQKLIKNFKLLGKQLFVPNAK